MGYLKGLFQTAFRAWRRGGGSLHFLFARFGIGIVLIAADVFFQTAFSFKYNALRNHVIQKHTVVADEEHGTGVVAQQFFQQFLRVDVQIVGRLVQQQDVGLLYPRLRQRDALFLPAGQIGDFFVFRQPQLADGLAHQRIEPPAVLRFDLVLQFVQFFDKAVVLLVRQLAADFVATPQHIAQAAQPFGHDVEHGGRAVEKALLRHIHGFQPVLQDELAVVGLLHAGEDF